MEEREMWPNGQIKMSSDLASQGYSNAAAESFYERRFYAPLEP